MHEEGLFSQNCGSEEGEPPVEFKHRRCGAARCPRYWIVCAREWVIECMCACVCVRYEVGWVVPTECSLTQRYSHLISSHLGAVRGSGEAQQQFTPHRRSCRSESSTCSQHQSLPHCDEPGVVLRDQSEPDVPRESFPYMQWATRFEG